MGFESCRGCEGFHGYGVCWSGEDCEGYGGYGECYGGHEVCGGSVRTVWALVAARAAEAWRVMEFGRSLTAKGALRAKGT